MKKLFRRAAAFTLLELSIVIVIIALMIGGILSGNALIAAAELRSIPADAQSYINAIGTFRSQYRYLPGDMINPAKYWSTASGTSIGNGDGLILSSTAEPFLAWQQLSLAGLTDASYSGASGYIIGTTVPASKFGLAGFGLLNDPTLSTSLDGRHYTGINYGNFLSFGLTSVATTAPGMALSATGALTPAEAYNIDKKVDDGIPGSGKWLTRSTSGLGLWNNTTSCTLGTGPTDYAAEYRLTNSTIACSFYILTGY